MLVAGPSADRWLAAAAAAAMGVQARRLVDPMIASALGLGLDGALLLRPDAVIAWRSNHAAGGHPEDVLREALRALGVR